MHISLLQVCGITGRSYTYSQLRDHSAALAIRFQTKFNFHIGDVIAVCLPNIPEYPIATLGAIEAGLIVTTINPIYTACKYSCANHEIKTSRKINRILSRINHLQVCVA